MDPARPCRWPYTFVVIFGAVVAALPTLAAFPAVHVLSRWVPTLETLPGRLGVHGRLAARVATPHGRRCRSQDCVRLETCSIGNGPAGPP